METPCQAWDHVLLGALVACAVASAGAQPAAQGNYSDYTAVGEQDMPVSKNMIALLAAAVAVFVVVVMATIYLRHCTGYGHDEGWSADLSAAGTVPAVDTFFSRRARRGLDAGVIETFPTMRYAEAKALRVGKVDAALECAVCLREFEDEETLRLLPKCSHAFHPDCIGEWLAVHVTCPVCRCNLDPDKVDTISDELVLPAPPQPANSVSSEVAVLRQDDGAAAQPAGAVVIDVVTQEEEERRREAMELQRIGTQRRAMRTSRPATARLARSHSTGHSHGAVRFDHDLERFTLRLPEHVRMAMVASGELVNSLRRRRNRLRRSFFSYTGTLPGRLPSFSASRTADSSIDGGELSSASSSWAARFIGKRMTAVNVAAGGSAKGASGPA